VRARQRRFLLQAIRLYTNSYTTLMVFLTETNRLKNFVSHPMPAGANLFLVNFFFQATLTPALSHWRGRGRIVGCHLENRPGGLAGRASAKPESSDICSFSGGRRSG
jgi:hypothetical protein